MELYIGGYGQGKLDYVLTNGLSKKNISDGKEINVGIVDGVRGKLDQYAKAQVFNHVHLWIRRMLKEGQDVAAQLEELQRLNPNLIYISDEVGSGIVPMEQMEREYREWVGRCCCQLAQRADHVYRIVAGLGIQIK